MEEEKADIVFDSDSRTSQLSVLMKKKDVCASTDINETWKKEEVRQSCSKSIHRLVPTRTSRNAVS